MQGIGSVVAAILLFGVAGVGFKIGVGNEYLLLAAGVGALLFARGVMGLVTGQTLNLGNAVEFVRDPAGTIVDGVFDRLADDGDQPQNARSETPLGRLSTLFGDGAEVSAGKPFDADAALARYMANRPAGSPAVDIPGVQPAAKPSFGRKGL